MGTRSLVVDHGSWVVSRGSEISHVYTCYVYIFLCCFNCPLLTAVLSKISFMLEFNVHCIFSSHISMYTSYYIALVL